MTGQMVGDFRFRASCVLEDIPGSEAQWVVRFIRASGETRRAEFATKAEAEAWLDERIKALKVAPEAAPEVAVEPLVIPAPDGDGVVVSVPGASIAVRVREASSLAGDPVLAAQIVERLHLVNRLLGEALEMGVGHGMPGRMALPMAAARDSIEANVATCLKCDVLEVHPVSSVPPVSPLSLVRSVGGVS